VQAVETEEVVAGVMMDSVMDASKMVRGGTQRVVGSRDERLIWRCLSLAPQAVRWARKAKTAAKALVQVTLEEGLAKTERRRARGEQHSNGRSVEPRSPSHGANF
jgi:hypothetical protein